MANEMMSISLPARFLAAGQSVAAGRQDASARVPGSVLLIIRESQAPGRGARGVVRQALLLPPGGSLPSGFDALPASRDYWLRFLPVDRPDSAQVSLSLLPVPLDESTFNRLSYTFHQLAGMGRSHSGPSDLGDYMLSVLLLSLREDTPRAPGSAVAARMMEYIRLHCFERLTLPDLSRALGYSEDYLSRLLHDQVSCSFRQYIHRLRLQRAKSELLSGAKSIREIAEDCGYSNVKIGRASCRERV